MFLGLGSAAPAAGQILHLPQEDRGLGGNLHCSLNGHLLVKMIRCRPLGSWSTPLRITPALSLASTYLPALKEWRKGKWCESLTVAGGSYFCWFPVV
jgi:hypothetical protein